MREDAGRIRARERHARRTKPTPRIAIIFSKYSAAHSFTAYDCFESGFSRPTSSMKANIYLPLLWQVIGKYKQWAFKMGLKV